MTDDELLQVAVKAVRAERSQRAHDARLDAFAAGEIDASRVAEEAHAAGMDAELEDELAGFRPLEASAREDIIARIEREMRTPRSRRPSLQNVRAARSLPALRQTRQVAVRRLTMAAGAIAMAASVGFFFRAQQNHGPRAGAASLPSYELASASGEQEWRGAPSADVDAEHRVARGDRMRLVVRPSTAIEGPLEARVFVRRGDDVRAWPSAIEVSHAGAVRIVASPASLPEGTTGAWEMLVAVGRPGAMPTSADLDGKHPAPRDVRIVRTSVTLE